MAADRVDELVARFQAYHNPLVRTLLETWGVIVDLDLSAPPTDDELAAIRRIAPSAPGVHVVFASNDISQRDESADTTPAEDDGVAGDDAKPKAAKKASPPRKGPRGSAPAGPPKARISPLRCTFIGSEQRRKSSLILDLILRRLAADPRAAGIAPSLHAQAFARKSGADDSRTRKTPAFDFDVTTQFHMFNGRESLPLTIIDVDGEKYHPETFGHEQCQNVQTTDALIVPIDTEALRSGGEVRATQDAIFVARLVEQFRYRRGLPIAFVIPAADMLMTEDELANLGESRLIPGEFREELLTSVATADIGRVAGGVACRLRHAAIRNPGVARSLNLLRLVDRLFSLYEPVFREAAAVSGTIGLFVTMTSTAKSGWSRTYGSVEVVDWIASRLRGPSPAGPPRRGRTRADPDRRPTSPGRLAPPPD